MASGLMNKIPRAIASAPAMISGGRDWLARARQATPITISRAASRAGRWAGLGRGGRADRARVTGSRAAARAGHHAAAGRRRDRQHHAEGDQAPRDGEPVDPVTGERLQVRGGHQPRRQAGDGPGNGGNDAHDGPARDHDHPKLLAGRPDRGEHAELALAARGDDSETSGGDQGDQQQQDRDQRERDRPRRLAWVLGPRACHSSGPRNDARKAPKLAGLASSSTVTDCGGPAHEGVTRTNWSFRSLGFSTIAGHRLVMAVEGQRGADAQLEGLR